MNEYYDYSKEIIDELDYSLKNIKKKDIDEYIKQICAADNVFFIGVGRVKISLEAGIKRFAHLGINCIMVGDLTEPPITKDDILIVASGSGESIIPLEITKKAKQIGAKILHITSNPDSSIAKLANHHVVIEAPNKQSREKLSIQPMSTLFEQTLFIFNDIVSLLIMRKNDIDLEDISVNHANLE